MTMSTPAIKAGMRLEGERIYLRPIIEGDANETYVGWLNDREVNRHLESRFEPHTLEGLRFYIESIRHSSANVFMAIVLKASPRHIGNIKLGPIDYRHRIGDVGFIIGEKDCWGKGYVTEAIRLMTDYAFSGLNLHKVTAGCYATNSGSARALMKAGFVEEGRLKSHCLTREGPYVDKICFGMINPRAAQ